MIRNLVISNIPKDENSIKRVLNYISERTWTKDTIISWIDLSIGSIYYDDSIDGYVWSLNGNIPNNYNLVYKTYEQLFER